MKWEMITAIGQMAAVFVGIPSVIYFALQLREQTRERRQSAVNALTVQWGDLTKALHETESLLPFIFAVCSPFTTSMLYRSFALALSKIASSRTSKECITQNVKGY